MTSPRIVLGACFSLLLLPPASLPAATPDFERAIAPILLRRCVECHAGPDASGKLDLTTSQGLRAGGKHGAPVVPGKPNDSLLIQRVAGGEMPPKKQGKAQPLPADERTRLSDWIAAGAAWPEGRTLDAFETTTDTRAGRDWWSFQPVRRPAIPAVRAKDRVANPIDAFVLAKLEARGWTMAPRADRRTLIRRATLDLLGLPPSYEEIEAFARDDAPDAYERLIDRLLASPHYGERWGRHWLDVVRYAETCGYERDQVKPGVWKYRDYVIRALNEDRPYDRFVREQLAGDELPDRSEETVIATGFIRLGTWNDEPNDPQEYKYDRLEDMVHATATAFLGLTVKCARCHDHKFDPIRQTDYYRMASAFWAGFIEPGTRELLGGPDAKTLGYDVHGWTDRGADVPSLKLLKKGDPARPGPVVEPGQLSVVPALDRPLKAAPKDSKTTTRRLQMAEWIVDPRNPLAARVWVNRLWQHHFGEGLVRSPDNFGFMGERPTHPELLDWLAAELVAGGWRAKPLHRLILLSEAYRQSSIHPRQAEYANTDAADRLWWRAQRRRLDAESLRDALLSAGGQLQAYRMGGPSFAPDIAAAALEGLSMKAAAWKASPPSEQGRRSVYVFSKRGLLPPFLTTFDAGDTTLPSCRRDVTTVAPQALALLNNPFVHQQSAKLARRIATAGKDRTGQVMRAWQAALGRSPRPAEIEAALAHLDAQERLFTEARRPEPGFLALASLCHVLLNTNEFVYVD
jgi:hypothetical protein